jgi:hypothetical protein
MLRRLGTIPPFPYASSWPMTLRETTDWWYLRTVPRRIIGPKMEEVAGNWRRLHNEELHNIFYQVLLV